MTTGKVLFHRDYRGYTGGHGKVWDYFRHFLALGWDARVYLTPESLRDAHNPWMTMPERIEPEWRPEHADLLFLAGMDWQALPRARDGRWPLVNLVQHVRHGNPEHPLHGFLDRPAWRVCVSQPVARAIVDTGRVNGPVRVISAALDVPADTVCVPDRGEGVFIGALKDPALGAALAALLRERGHAVTLADGWMPRDAYLKAIADAAVAVPLPHPAEGFFLPGLEAMALGRPVVMPACAGSAEYATDGHNCLMPDPQPDALAAAIERLLADPLLRSRLVTAGLATAARHGQDAERAALAGLLKEMLQ